MTSIPASQPAPAGSAVTADARPTDYRASFAQVVRSEWIKLTSVRSTLITLGLAVVIAIGISAAISAAVSGAHSPSSNPAAISVSGFEFSQLVLGVFGVMAVTGEYSQSTVRVSLLAVPNRLRLWVAKLLVITVVSLVVCEVSSFVSFFLGQALLSGSSTGSVGIGQGSTLRIVVGTGLYVTAITLLAAAFGLLFRSTAAGICVIVGCLFVVPIILALLPSGSLWDDFRHYWPISAGQRVFDLGSGAVGHWEGLIILVGTAVVIAAAAGWSFLRRDA